jgi:glycosyltransferase involved in cell wall biosynthesis
MPASARSARRIAVLTQQVSHYHAARYRAARLEFPHLRVYSVMNSADFSEFLSNDADPKHGAHLRRHGPLLEGRDFGQVVAAHARAPGRIQAGGGGGRGAGRSRRALAAIDWARGAGAHVALMSDSQAHDAQRIRWREAVKRRVVSACDSALVAGATHGDYAHQLGIPRERVFYGYDVVDNEHFESGADEARANARAQRAARGLPQRYLLASGRFLKKKNFPRLVEAFADCLRERDHGFDLMILGDGRERALVERIAQRRGIAHRLRLPGFRHYDALPAIYGLASGFVHVPTAEQWGLVINEAAASGLPLIVSSPCGASNALVEPGCERLPGGSEQHGRHRARPPAAHVAHAGGAR